MEGGHESPRAGLEGGAKTEIIENVPHPELTKPPKFDSGDPEVNSVSFVGSCLGGNPKI